VISGFFSTHVPCSAIQYGGKQNKLLSIDVVQEIHTDVLNRVLYK
jgi:hypothetical protein